MSDVGVCASCGANRILKDEYCKRCRREGLAEEKEK